MLKPVQIALLVLALLGCSGMEALAHASLVSSIPMDGAVIPSSPASLVLRFNEPVAVTRISLASSDGSQRDLVFAVRNDEVSVSLAPELPPGSQAVSYRVISADGHPVSGSIVFSIGEATPNSQNSTDTPLVAGAIWATRLAVYIGLLGAAGGALFANWTAPQLTPARIVTCLRAVALLGALTLALSIGLQGLDMTGAGFAALLRSPTWALGVRSSLGACVLVEMATCLGAFLSLTNKPGRAGRVLSLAALVGAGVALSLTGHASSADPQWLMRTAVAVHGAAAAYWVGGLWPLAGVVQANGAGSLPTVRRFSAAAMFAVAALVATGAVLSVVQIGSWSALTETNYGRLWLAKLSAVVLMLGFAGVNRVWLTPALALSAHASKRLVLSIVLEAILSVVVLGIVAGWRFTPPPRASAPLAASAIHVHLHGLKAMADVELRPGKSGPVEVSALILAGDFQPLEPKELTFNFSNAGAGIEPFERPARPMADGHWVATGVALPAPGLWTVRAEVLISDFDKEIIEADVSVP